MKLNKRNCEVRIRLTPCDADFLRVHFRIGGDNHYFYPSRVMGHQFGIFLSAVYCLYEEDDLPHLFYFRGMKQFHRERCKDDGKTVTRSNIWWDEEGRIVDITLSRRSDKTDPPGMMDPDPVEIDCSTFRGKFHYTLDGRDLCYAVAKGCTEALKKYGFKGYPMSTGMQYRGDTFDINELLFIKAYALGVLDEARKTEQAYEHPDGLARADRSSFANEIELLLFDM